MWMDDGSGEYTKDGSSKYTEVLDALIGAFVDAHPQIDRSLHLHRSAAPTALYDHEQIISTRPATLPHIRSARLWRMHLSPMKTS